jgi:hypothetical protein
MVHQMDLSQPNCHQAISCPGSKTIIQGRKWKQRSTWWYCESVGGDSPGQLEGLRVLELGSLIAGPFCTRQLADMGARVLKVEPPGVGDALRNWSIVTEEGSLWSMVQSRNKESIAIDLRKPEGQSLVRRLAERVDVLVENFRPGRLEAWGLGPRELLESNPDLVMVRISGFGQDGPYRDRPGYGSTGESMGGLRYVTGFPDRPPLKMGVSIGDRRALRHHRDACRPPTPRRHRSRRGCRRGAPRGRLQPSRGHPAGVCAFRRGA